MSKRSLHLKRTIYDDLSEDEDENENLKISEPLNNILKMKTGRKPRPENKKKDKDTHSKYSQDNMRNIIMRYFLKYSFLFFEDYMNKKCQIKDLNIKRKIIGNSFNSNLIKKIMDMTVLDFYLDIIFFDKINPFNLLFNLLPCLNKDFPNLKMLDFYENFFISKNVEEIKKTFSINIKIKNFYEFLEKYNYDIKYKNALRKTGENLIEFMNKYGKIKTQTSNQNLINNNKSLETFLNDDIDFGYDDIDTILFPKEDIFSFNEENYN